MTSLSTQLIAGHGRIVTVKEVTRLYRELVSQSIPNWGRIQRISSDSYGLSARFTTVDCDNLESITTVKVYSLTTKTHSVRCISDAIEVNDLITETSDNGQFLARLKSRENGSKKKQSLEIWNRSRLIKTLDTTDSPVNADEHFTSVQWSRFDDQDKLLYVCQPKRPKFVSFFETKEDADENCRRGEEYKKKEDWGETLDGIEHTQLAILDVPSGCQVSTIDVPGFSLANSQWLKSGTVSVAYQEQPRLGPIFCNNRPSKIVVHDSSRNILFEIESKTECYHTVRVNTAGDKFLYLSNPVYGPHKHASRLNICDVRTRSSKQLVDSKTGKEEFFFQDIPTNCFTSDDKHLLFTTLNNLNHEMMLYNLEKSEISTIKFPTSGLSILDFKHDIILASGHDINAIPTLFVAVLNIENTSDVVAWHQIEDCIHLNEINYEPIFLPTRDNAATISAIFVKPNLQVLQSSSEFQPDPSTPLLMQTNQLPTVVLVHGGPNSAFSIEYLPILVLFTRLGLNTLLINYRGSTGVSKEHVQCLSGNVGKMDVEDCLHVVKSFINEDKINSEKLIIYGGSHGGFLACHLSCQDEVKFTSAIMRNPVVDIGSLQFTSDIPDWARNVSLGFDRYESNRILTHEEFRKIDECCPVLKGDKASVPTLMQLGNKDRRVNMYQGELWVSILQARGIDTLKQIYPDNHALSKPEVRADVTISSIIWMLNHLPK